MQPIEDLKILDHTVEQMGQDIKLSLTLDGKEVNEQTKVSLTLHGVRDARVSPSGQGLVITNEADGAPVVLMFAAPVGFFM